jgi:hypothetical protein
MEKKWEFVPCEGKDTSRDTHRLKVPGGWLVRTTVKTTSYGLLSFIFGDRVSTSVALILYRDSNHDWNPF